MILPHMLAHARPIARLIAALTLLLTGCGMTTITPPPTNDLAGLQRPSSPNTALAAPAGFRPKPDIITPTYDIPPERLFALVNGIVAARPRTQRLSEDKDRFRANDVERSLVFHFPDLIELQVLPADGGRSELVLYSRSVQGHYDFGVNRRRLEAILAKLQASAQAR